MGSPPASAQEDQRQETSLERLDRNTIELLNELRVAATGIQVMFGFLLIVPFNDRFRRLSSFERIDYFITLICVAVAAVLLMAPSIHHRILFRHGRSATSSRLPTASRSWPWCSWARASPAS